MPGGGLCRVPSPRNCETCGALIPLCYQEHTVQAVVVARFLRTPNLILKNQKHFLDILNRYRTHISFFTVRMKTWKELSPEGTVILEFPSIEALRWQRELEITDDLVELSIRIAHHVGVRAEEKINPS
jgi:hypothetical protein